MRTQQWWIPYLFIFPALFGLGLFRLVPIIVSLAGSLTTQTLTGETIPAGLENYTQLFADRGFWSSLRITLVFNLLINPIQVILAFGLALLVARPTAGVGIFRTIYFLPMTMSLAIVSILWNLLLDPNLGVINGILRALSLPPQPFFRSPDQALGSLIWLATWKGIGYWMMFLLAGLNSISEQLYEASRLDGASIWDNFRYITVPLMRRPLAFVLVADTVVNFLFFAPIYIITRGGPMGSTRLLMYEAYRAAFVSLDLGRSLTLSTVLLVIILAFAFFELRLFKGDTE
jgi:multiple sugar transport system permease protein